MSEAAPPSLRRRGTAAHTPSSDAGAKAEGGLRAWTMKDSEDGASIENAITLGVGDPMLERYEGWSLQAVARAGGLEVVGRQAGAAARPFGGRDNNADLGRAEAGTSGKQCVEIEPRPDAAPP